MGVSERHFWCLLRRFRLDGVAGIVSGHRSKPSNNRLAPENRQTIIDKLHEKHSDFGPALASEKLEERDEAVVSKETVRQIMISEGLHNSKTRKEEKVRQMWNAESIEENWCRSTAPVTTGWKTGQRVPVSS